MRLTKYYQVGIDIQERAILYVIVKNKKIVDHQKIVLSDDILQHGNIINYSLLLEQLNHIREKLPKLHHCSIALSEQQTLNQSLTLPDIVLSSQEKYQFVLANKKRLFALNPDELTVDYCQISESSEIVVVATRQSLIEQWEAIFKQTALSLTLITENKILDNVQYQLLEHFQLAESLARSIDLNVINFLPWREQYWYNQRKQLVILFCGMLLLCSVIICAGYFYFQSEQSKLIDIQKVKTNDYQNLTAKILRINKLNQELTIKLTEQKNNEIIINNQRQIFFYLNFIAGHLPHDIWLESLDINQRKIIISGNAFLYESISQLLKQLETVQFAISTQLHKIKRQQGKLIFTLSIELEQAINHE